MVRATVVNITSRQWRWLLLVAILCLATATRVHDLDLRSLWEDEGWTLVLAEGPSLSDVARRMAYDQHPPLYFMIFRLWEDVTGSSEFSLRYLSVLTGIVGVAGMYQLGKTAFNTSIGLLAMLLLALWDHHIDLSQDARHYSQLATLIILSTWFYFRLITPNQTRHHLRVNSALYLLLSSALLYSHYLGGFVLICHAIHMLLFVRPLAHLRWCLFVFISVCLSFLPWLPIVIRQNQVRWETPLYYLNSLPNNHNTYLMVRDALLGKQYALFGFFIIWGLFVVFTQSAWRTRWITLLFLMWGIGYIAMTYYLNSIPNRQFLTIRNFIVVTPALLMMMAIGLNALPLRLKSLMIAVIVVLSLTTIDTQQLKPPWREVFQNVTNYHSPNEPVLMDIWVGDFPGRYYVEQQMGSSTPWLSLRETRDDYRAQFLPVLKGYLADYEAFWLVYWRSITVDEIEYAEIFKQLGFQRTASFVVDHVGNHIYSYRYDRRPKETLATYQAENGAVIELHHASVTNDPPAVQLLLSTPQSIDIDYSLSVVLISEDGQVVWNQDQPPITPTSQWQPEQLFYDIHRLHLPDSLPKGRYRVAIKLYYYLEPNRPLKTCTLKQIECEWFIIGEFIH